MLLMRQAVHYINTKQPLVTAFYNGSDVGIDDTKNEVAWHYMEHGLDEEMLDLFTFKEKSYAWLRNWMDINIPESMIIKVIRYMVMSGIHDTRDIDDEIFYELVDGEEDLVDEREMLMYIPDISIGDLKELSGSLLGGGAKHECLKEIQLFMNAFNIRYRLVNDWIYG